MAEEVQGFDDPFIDKLRNLTNAWQDMGFELDGLKGEQALTTEQVGALTAADAKNVEAGPFGAGGHRRHLLWGAPAYHPARARATAPRGR